MILRRSLRKKTSWDHLNHAYESSSSARLIEGLLEAKTSLAKDDGSVKHLGVYPYPDYICHFGYFLQCGIAGGERVPPAPLGWYFLFQL